MVELNVRKRIMWKISYLIYISKAKGLPCEKPLYSQTQNFRLRVSLQALLSSCIINFIRLVFYAGKRIVTTSRNFSARLHPSLCKNPLKRPVHMLLTYIFSGTSWHFYHRFTMYTSLMSEVGRLLKWLSITTNDRDAIKTFIVNQIWKMFL